MSAKLEGYKMYAGWKSTALKTVEMYVDSIMQKNILEARDDAIHHIKKNNSVVTGELSREDSFEIIKERGTDLNVSYSMRNIMPYAHAVERGTKPHKVPLSKLVFYVMRKHGYTKDEAESRAKSIQKTIEAKGTGPYPFMRPAFDAMRVQLKKDLKRVSSETGIGGRQFTRLYGAGKGTGERPRLYGE